ncbi:hypothetical protein [uncultured Thiodictyon sp.]|uniref:TolB family protein n=1 Tax=uncultured Thiodictyon sp. TaxID=1846217 RepID=UPI0025DF9A4F|nr:hypothetical protein [uncultured Thiodictyon sp.]
MLNGHRSNTERPGAHSEVQSFSTMGAVMNPHHPGLTPSLAVTAAARMNVKRVSVTASLIAGLFFSAFVLAAVPGQIAFSSNRSGNYEIYRKNLVTGAIADLTNDPANDMNPQVSRDGRYLAFYSDRTGNNQIYKIDLLNPGPVARLTNDGASNYDPAFFPDGRILFKSNLKDGYGDIWIMDANGLNQRNLTPLLSTTEEWKPDATSSTSVAFVSGLRDASEIYTLDLTSNALRRLTNNQLPDWYPAVSPDGARIAFVSKDSPNSPDALFIITVDGQGRSRITSFPGDADDPAWSPDGQYITFVGRNGATYDIYALNIRSGQIEVLESDPRGDELSPIFLPAPNDPLINLPPWRHAVF